MTPSLVKFSVSNLDDNGKTVGELGALNTIGSIIGTFLPTFVTIPAVGTAATFLIFSAVLAAIAVVYFVTVKEKRTLYRNRCRASRFGSADTGIQFRFLGEGCDTGG